jgi:type IV pilus assembly protein PilY1
MDVEQPVTPTPTVAWDSRFNKWVFFGTGRMFVDGDKESTGVQSLYGVRDPGADAELPVAKTNLVNVTGVTVYSNEEVSGIADADGKSDGTTDGTVTFRELVDFINTYDSGTDGPDKQGWFKDMPSGNRDGDPDIEPSTRSFSSSALIGSVLISAAYAPGDHDCNALGESTLYGLYYLTGTASPELEIFGTVPDGDSYRVIDVVELGEGVSSSPSIHVDNPAGGSGEGGVTVITQTGVAAIEREQAQTKDTTRSGEISWREEIGQ